LLALDVEALGLVKFDFLGLSNLTVIDKTLKLVHAKGLSEALIDIDKDRSMSVVTLSSELYRFVNSSENHLSLFS
jgi:DNA polymerase III alpha subunit